MKLVYFAWLRERLECSEEEVTLPETVLTVNDLFAWQKSRGELHASAFEQDEIIQVAINQVHVQNRESEIADANEIAFFPPMTGG